MSDHLTTIGAGQARAQSHPPRVICQLHKVEPVRSAEWLDQCCHSVYTTSARSSLADLPLPKWAAAMWNTWSGLGACPLPAHCTSRVLSLTVARRDRTSPLLRNPRPHAGRTRFRATPFASQLFASGTLRAVDKLFFASGVFAFFGVGSVRPGACGGGVTWSQ